MARPRKLGMDYFQHDTDCGADGKLRAFQSIFRNDGYAFFFKLLERIFRESPAELNISPEWVKKDLCRYVGVSEKKFNEMLNLSFDIGLFDRQAFTDRNVLTSNGIQRREHFVQGERERKNRSYAQRISGGETIGETTEKLPEKQTEKARQNPGISADRTEQHSTAQNSTEQSSTVQTGYEKHVERERRNPRREPGYPN